MTDEGGEMLQVGLWVPEMNEEIREEMGNEAPQIESIVQLVTLAGVPNVAETVEVAHERDLLALAAHCQWLADELYGMARMEREGSLEEPDEDSLERGPGDPPELGPLGDDGRMYR